MAETDGGSLVRSENSTAGRNGPLIELSHGRFIACHKINFHIKPEKRGGSTYSRVLHFFFGVNIWGLTLCEVDLYAIIYGIGATLYLSGVAN